MNAVTFERGQPEREQGGLRSIARSLAQDASRFRAAFASLVCDRDCHRRLKDGEWVGE